MRKEAFWAMDEADEALAADLELGLGSAPARVLAYLLRRATDDRVSDARARRIDVRLGTDLGRQPVADALSTLSERGLITETTLESDRGRPPRAWSTDYTVETAMYDVYAAHADELLEGVDGVAGTPETGDGPLRLGFNWQPNGLHVPFYAATLENAFEMAGVDVEFVHYRGSKRALGAVSAGDVDVGIVGAATLTEARQRGESVAPLAVVYQRAMTVLYTIREAFGEPLTESEQLRGRSVGMSPSTETRLLAELFLSQAGLADDIEVVETDGEESAALRSGEADVVTGSFSDPWKLQDEYTVDVLTISEQFPIYGPALVVDPAEPGVGSESLERFLTGTLLGWRAGRADPTPAARRIADRTDDDREEVERTFREAVDTFADSKASRTGGWGVHSADEWERVRTALARTRRLGE